jgi:predicted Zn-dependent protease
VTTKLFVFLAALGGALCGFAIAATALSQPKQALPYDELERLLQNQVELTKVWRTLAESNEKLAKANADRAIAAEQLDRAAKLIERNFCQEKTR